MASLPPFAARRLLYQRSVGHVLVRPSCFLSVSQTRSISDKARSERTMNKLYKSHESNEKIGPSMRTQNQQPAMMDEVSQLLLPNTFITPPMSRRPAIFGDFKNRITFEWVRVKIRFQDIFSRVIARLWYGDTFFRNDVIPSAEALHRNMYTAYARGDIETLSDICGRDLFNTFRSRISSRPRNVQFSWKFDKYNSSSKIASHKVGMLGLTKESEDTIRQAVIKIDSTQTLTKGISGKVVKGTGEPVRTTEYIVVSKRKKKDTPEGPWIVWGTVSESGMEDVKAYDVLPSQNQDMVSGSSSRWG